MTSSGSCRLCLHRLAPWSIAWISRAAMRLLKPLLSGSVVFSWRPFAFAPVAFAPDAPRAIREIAPTACCPLTPARSDNSRCPFSLLDRPDFLKDVARPSGSALRSRHPLLDAIADDSDRVPVFFRRWPPARRSFCDGLSSRRSRLILQDLNDQLLFPCQHAVRTHHESRDNRWYLASLQLRKLACSSPGRPV